MKHINTKTNITPIQLKLPVDYEKIIKLSDPVYSFREIMAQIDRNQFLRLRNVKQVVLSLWIMLRSVFAIPIFQRKGI